MVYPYNGILFGSEKEQTPDTCYNINEPCKHAKIKEASHRILHSKWFHLYEMSRLGKL